MKWLIRIISLGGIWGYFFTYKFIFCYYYTTKDDVDQVACIKYWKFCLLFCISYSLILIFRNEKLSIMSIFKSYCAVVILYIISLGVLSPLYMIGSFFQPFYRNVVMHYTIFFFIFEWVSLWFENRYAPKNTNQQL